MTGMTWASADVGVAQEILQGMSTVWKWTYPRGAASEPDALSGDSTAAMGSSLGQSP